MNLAADLRFIASGHHPDYPTFGHDDNIVEINVEYLRDIADAVDEVETSWNEGWDAGYVQGEFERQAVAVNNANLRSDLLKAQQRIEQLERELSASDRVRLARVDL